MKKLVITLISLSVFLLVFVFITRELENNLLEKKQKVDLIWKDINKLTTQKMSIFYKNIQYFEVNNEIIATVKYNFKNQKCNIEYNQLLFVLDSLISNSKLEKKIHDELIKQDSIFNLKIDLYNDKALSFNRYASTFPILIIARKNKIKTFDKIHILFGKENYNTKKTKEKVFERLREIEKREGL